MRRSARPSMAEDVRESQDGGGFSMANQLTRAPTSLSGASPPIVKLVHVRLSSVLLASSCISQRLSASSCHHSVCGPFQHSRLSCKAAICPGSCLRLYVLAAAFVCTPWQLHSQAASAAGLRTLRCTHSCRSRYQCTTSRAQCTAEPAADSTHAVHYIIKQVPVTSVLHRQLLTRHMLGCIS